MRCITNIFSGRIVAKVAAEAAGHGHRVILFTTHPEVLHGGTGIRVRLSRTFADLDALMAAEVASDGYTR